MTKSHELTTMNKGKWAMIAVLEFLCVYFDEEISYNSYKSFLQLRKNTIGRTIFTCIGQR